MKIRVPPKQVLEKKVFRTGEIQGGNSLATTGLVKSSFFMRRYRKLLRVYYGQGKSLKSSKAIPPQTTIHRVSKQVSGTFSMETRDRFLYVIFWKLQDRATLIAKKLTDGWWRTKFSNPKYYQQLKHLQLSEDYFIQFSSNNTHSFTYLPESVEELFFTEELERNKHQLWPLILWMICWKLH